MSHPWANKKGGHTLRGGGGGGEGKQIECYYITTPEDFSPTPQHNGGEDDVIRWDKCFSSMSLLNWLSQGYSYMASKFIYFLIILLTFPWPCFLFSRTCWSDSVFTKRSPWADYIVKEQPQHWVWSAAPNRAYSEFQVYFHRCFL